MRTATPVLVAFLIFSCQTAPKRSARIPSTVKEYTHLVEDQLGPLWYRLIKANEDGVSVGTVKTTFEISAAGGRIRNLKIISNTGGGVSERIAREAIDQLRAPSIPPQLLRQLHQNYIVFEESFTIYEERTPKPSANTKKR